jgi:hypothetical protein
MAIYAELQQKLAFLDSLSELPDMESIFEEDFPERYMITLGKPTGNREEHAMAFTRLTRALRDRIPILASDRVGVYSDWRLFVPDTELVQAIPMILTEKDGAERSLIRTIPAGRYVCMYYRNGILEKYDRSFDRLNRYLGEHHYEISGDILQIYKVDVTLTDIPEETVIVIQVPVTRPS